MILYSAVLTALDGEYITPRTGSAKKEVSTIKLPKDYDYIPFIYTNSDDSPGVVIATDNVSWLSDDRCTFEDNEGRLFELSKITKDINE